MPRLGTHPFGVTSCVRLLPGLTGQVSWGMIVTPHEGTGVTRVELTAS